MMVLLILSFILSLFSCSNEVIPEEREIYIVTVADDFYNYNGNGRKLENVVTDQAALSMQFQTFGDIHIRSYISQDGKRYTSSSPLYVPVDKNKNELERNDDENFKSFMYKPKIGEEESGWRIYDVMEYLGSLVLGEDDILIFSYSGHGEKPSGALMTNASETSTVWDSISPEDLLERISTLGGKKLVILDSCYSGIYIPSSPLSTSDVFSTEEKEDRWVGISYPKAMKDALLTKRDKYPYSDIWILSSTGRGQEASDSLDGGDGPFQLSYGAFTYYLLKALGYDTDRNEAVEGDSSLTVYSIYSYVRKHFPDYETQIQTPRVSNGGLDLALR